MSAAPDKQPSDDGCPTPGELREKIDELMRLERDQLALTRRMRLEVAEIHRRIVASPNPILPRDDYGGGQP